MSQFSIKTTGKWILAGEHAVLRGSPALVFPLESRTLELTYDGPSSLPKESPEDLTLALSGEFGQELQILFWGVLEKACELRQLSRNHFTGRVRVHSEIPVGAGLGASAALCVAVSSWLAYLHLIEENEVVEFSRNLENLFHGESSGVDIAVAYAGRALRFQRGQAPTNLTVNWKPRLYISYSGQRGVTLECVNQVKKLHATQPERAQLLDQKMRRSVELCEESLVLNAETGFQVLAGAMTDAAETFHQWGLVDAAPQAHIEWLQGKGAVAVKPTGSGKGGFILSLWRTEPPADIRERLIPCFA